MTPPPQKQNSMMWPMLIPSSKPLALLDHFPSWKPALHVLVLAVALEYFAHIGQQLYDSSTVIGNWRTARVRRQGQHTDDHSRRGLSLCFFLMSRSLRFAGLFHINWSQFISNYCVAPWEPKALADQNHLTSIDRSQTQEPIIDHDISSHQVIFFIIIFFMTSASGYRHSLESQQVVDQDTSEGPSG